MDPYYLFLIYYLLNPNINFHYSHTMYCFHYQTVSILPVMVYKKLLHYFRLNNIHLLNLLFLLHPHYTMDLNYLCLNNSIINPKINLNLTYMDYLYHFQMLYILNFPINSISFLSHFNY